MSTPQELAPILAATLVSIANAQNEAAILNYQQSMTIYHKIYGTNPSTSAPPAPFPPQLVSVNTALVEQLEVQTPPAPDSAWMEIYSYSTYEPPPPVPPVVALPSVVVEPFGIGYPGWFELAPDSPLVTIGTSVTINGVSYTKGVVAENPFAPNGQVTAWKQS